MRPRKPALDHRWLPAVAVAVAACSALGAAGSAESPMARRERGSTWPRSSSARIGMLLSLTLLALAAGTLTGSGRTPRLVAGHTTEGNR